MSSMRQKNDKHTNLKMMCHILFIQCEICKEKYDGCCSVERMKIKSLPIEKQKVLRKQNLKLRSHSPLQR